MMDDGDEAEKLRQEDGDWTDDATRAERPGNLGAVSLVAQTGSSSQYPTAASAYYSLTVASVFGPEVEGGPGTVTPGPGEFLALNLGGSIPPQGTNVIASFIGNRWVFRYD